MGVVVRLDPSDVTTLQDGAPMLLNASQEAEDIVEYAILEFDLVPLLLEVEAPVSVCPVVDAPFDLFLSSRPK